MSEQTGAWTLHLSSGGTVTLTVRDVGLLSNEAVSRLRTVLAAMSDLGDAIDNPSK